MMKIEKQIEEVEVLLQKTRKVTDASKTKDSVDGEQKKRRHCFGDSTRKKMCINFPKTVYRNVADSVNGQKCLSDMAEHRKREEKGKKRRKKSRKTQLQKQKPKQYRNCKNYQNSLNRNGFRHKYRN